MPMRIESPKVSGTKIQWNMDVRANFSLEASTRFNESVIVFCFVLGKYNNYNLKVVQKITTLD